MIVRIFTEGQYELADAALDGLHELDARTEAAVQDADEQLFNELYGQLLSHIRDAGRPLAADDLRASDLILPPPDVSLAEVAREFHGHHLLPIAG